MKITIILQQRFKDLQCPLDKERIQYMLEHSQNYEWLSPIGHAFLRSREVAVDGVLLEVQRKGVRLEHVYWAFNALGAIIRCRIRGRSYFEIKQCEQMYYAWAKPVRESAALKK